MTTKGNFMVVSRILDVLSSANIIHVPAMNAYHALKNNVFLNTKDKQATQLEAAGNFFLSPVRYLFNGKTVTRIALGDSCKIEQSFDYAKDSSRCEIIKTILAILSLPFSLIVGGTLKGLSYIDSSIREKHKVIYQ